MIGSFWECDLITLQPHKEYHGVGVGKAIKIGGGKMTSRAEKPICFMNGYFLVPANGARWS